MQYMQHALDFDSLAIDSPEAVQVYGYLEHALNNSFFTKSYMFSLPGTRHTYLCVSTPASTSQFNENMHQNNMNMPVRIPAWARYAVWEYTDLSIMNFHGVLQELYQGHRLAEDLYGWIQQQHNRLGKVLIQTPLVGGIDHDSLRSALASLGIPVWMEISVGHSLQAYHALDVYIKMVTPGVPPPQEEAWYLMNAVWQRFPHREYIPPDQWYRCADMICWGQRGSMDNQQYRNVHPLQLRSIARRNHIVTRARM